MFRICQRRIGKRIFIALEESQEWIIHQMLGSNARRGEFISIHIGKNKFTEDVFRIGHLVERGGKLI